ncbi:hypothetical protein [Dyadobacter sp. LHD-138]|uniref:hypothetical protein n=1 Tax=Dyadobacter sp. LHD-138 TaxID=3071413 RepID=UPI0027E05063|nr:hypothetical protein [Dyadobacter sp. LHD-138]MDQ6482408.1 hypothetical protein [Dyadobacter sp. LHD-138]
MDRNKLVQLERQLSDYKKQFETNYDHGSHGPFGRDKNQRDAAKIAYQNAIFYTASLLHSSGIYELLESRGTDINVVNRIWKNSKAAGFRYDINKLLDAISFELRKPTDD